MKELYIRKGNSEETKDIIIIGEEQELGSRDSSGYKPSKGTPFKPLVKKDPFSGSTGLTYIHATPNVQLDTSRYSRDYDVHKFVKDMCSDLVKWDGETNSGRVRSREAFIVKHGNTQPICDELWKRIETEIHGGAPSRHVFFKKFFRVVGIIISIPFKILFFILRVMFGKKKRRRRRFKIF